MVIFSISVLMFLVVVVFSSLLRRFVNRHYTGPSEAKRRDVNRQLNKNMLIQVYSCL
jgi:hypothetical protein